VEREQQEVSRRGMSTIKRSGTKSVKQPKKEQTEAVVKEKDEEEEEEEE
jgi:hypothetical protein